MYERLKGVTTRDLLDKDLPVLPRRTGIEPETIQDVRRIALGIHRRDESRSKQSDSKGAES